MNWLISVDLDDGSTRTVSAEAPGAVGALEAMLQMLGEEGELGRVLGLQLRPQLRRQERETADPETGLIGADGSPLGPDKHDPGVDPDPVEPDLEVLE